MKLCRVTLPPSKDFSDRRRRERVNCWASLENEVEAQPPGGSRATRIVPKSHVEEWRSAESVGMLNFQGCRAPVAHSLDNLLASLASDYGQCFLKLTKLAFSRYVHASLKGVFLNQLEQRQTACRPDNLCCRTHGVVE